MAPLEVNQVPDTEKGEGYDSEDQGGREQRHLLTGSRTQL